MAAQVLAENVHAGKALAAARDGARVRLLARVAAQVHDELHLGAECLAATRAVVPVAAAGRRVAVAHAAHVEFHDVAGELRDSFKGAIAQHPAAGDDAVVAIVVIASGGGRGGSAARGGGGRARHGHAGGGVRRRTRHGHQTKVVDRKGRGSRRKGLTAASIGRDKTRKKSLFSRNFTNPHCSFSCSALVSNLGYRARTAAAETRSRRKEEKAPPFSWQSGCVGGG